MIRTFVRASLWLLLPVAMLVTLEAIAVGLFFGRANLFQWHRPFAVMLWAAYVLYPAFVVHALASTRVRHVGYSREQAGPSEVNGKLYTLAALAWLFLAFILYHALIWQPHLHGGPWGW